MTEHILGGEFEDREKQLPPEDSPGYVAQGSSTEAAQADLSGTPLGAPPSCFDVRSVYDSRPVNGYDFMIPVTVTEEDASTFLASFLVRQGFVGVLREISHFFTDNPQPAVVNRAQCLATIQRNGADVPDNINIPVGLASDSIWKGFVVADEFNELAARIVLQGGLTADVCVVVFYGNYLLKSGVAYPFEIANPTGNCGPRAAPPMLPPVMVAPAPAPRALPAPTPAPRPAAPRGPEVPPFRVRWMKPNVFHSAGSQSSGKKFAMYPAYDNGQPLSQGDQKRYAEYLAATKPG